MSTVLGSLVLPVQCFTAAALCSCFASSLRLSSSLDLHPHYKLSTSVSEARASRLLYNSVKQLDDNGVCGDPSLENGERSERVWFCSTEREHTAGDDV